MTQTHTPGPWHVEPATTKAGRATLCIGAPSRRIFDMRAWDDEDYANARLIAAAPDMLAALREAHAVLALAQASGDDGVTHVLAQVGAAIAKATS